MRIHLGISTCPNDTFAFHGILKKCVNLRGLEFAIELLDVEELNRRLLAGPIEGFSRWRPPACTLSGGAHDGDAAVSTVSC